MSKKVLINGFGRMGRLFLRAAWGSDSFDIVQINELRGDAATAAHLLEFDSVHGRWDKKVTVENDRLYIEGQELVFSNAPEPAQVAVQGIDIVVECTGKFKSKDSLQPYFDHGVAKVLVSAPVKESGVLNVVYGVNDHLYKPLENHLVTAASCTTNCLAPVVKVMQEKIGIDRGLITTIHDITNTQTIIDLPHKDWRRARACSQSLIPTTTGSATAITLIYPELRGKLNGLAVRVPLLNASLTDCVFEVSRPTCVEEVNGFLKEASETYLQGILGYEERPLVSVDYKDDRRSSIIDAQSTMVNDGTQVKILAWYDNEIGYVNRMFDFCRKIADCL